MTDGGTGHAIHFLERLSRAGEAQRELALSLYWDPAVVRFVLATASLPPGDGRVALSLHEADRGPWLVVEREGRFVTCLAEGMAHGLPVIEHARLAALMAKAAVQRERVELAKELCGDRRLGSVFGILRERGEAVCREEFLAAAALQPVLGAKLLCDATREFSIISDLSIYLRGRKAIKDRDERHLRDYWQRLWYMSVLFPLFALGGSRGFDDLFDRLDEDHGGASLSWALTRHDDRMLALRGLYCVAKIGKPLLAGYKRRYREANSILSYCDTLLGLATLGAKLPRYRKEILTTITRFKDLDHRVMPFLKKLPDEWLKILLYAIETPRVIDEILGRRYQERFLELDAEVKLPEQYRFERPEDVPVDLAYAVEANFSQPYCEPPERLVDLLCFVPWLARIEGPELFLPRDLMAVIPSPFTRERAIEMLFRRERVYEQVFGPRQETVTVEPVVGRNAPCPCGSGKKYKKCCLGK